MSIKLEEQDLSKLSPMMQHYLQTKKEYPGCILFYRLGDFYEMFFEDAEIVFVAFGTMSRLCVEAIEILEERGIKAGLIRPISLWPYPEAAFDKIGPNAKVVISTELSMGQMIEDVKLATQCGVKTEHFGRFGGIIPTPGEVLEALENKIIK